MQASAKRHVAQPIEYRRFRPEESDVLPRYFMQAGYLLPVTPQDAGWGAWSAGELVGALALTHMPGGWLLRGPEIVSGYRRRGVGAALLDLALPDLRGIECYCACYSHVVPMFVRVGFKAFPPSEAPAYFAQQMAIGRKAQSTLVLLKRAPG